MTLFTVFPQMSELGCAPTAGLQIKRKNCIQKVVKTY